MPKLIVIARLLLSPLLLILSACNLGGTSYSNRIGIDGHDTLHSQARAKNGVARFECKASDSGSCHYTLYPDACAGKADCTLAPLQRFAVARGKTREIAGLRDFRVCVAIDAAAIGADCQPVAAARGG
ncbi:MAG TPA: hypothetical protein VN205_11425 [Thermomonas sp.]|nr:hypothetical protein [Thermomonas sp.]